MSKKANVLIVEDSPWLGAHNKRVLERENCEVRIANNALEALDDIEKKLPEVIILDMLLPAYNGLTFLHELRSYHDLAQIPVIVTSTIASMFGQADLETYGVVQVLDKTTMRPKDLVDAVKGIVL